MTTTKSEVEKNPNRVRVGTELIYSDMANYEKYKVVEIFDGGFVINDNGHNQDYYFDTLQIGWKFA